MMIHDESAVRQEVITNLDLARMVSCGAGGGKTSLLVDHYLHLLQSGVSPSRLVAVTFTEAAAAELKDRIRRQCRQRAQATAPPWEGSPEPDWKQLAREVESAPISTIHGFCAGLLREHALAAGLDPEFAVMDATEAGLLLADVAREQLLVGLGADRETAARLIGELSLARAADLVADLVQQRGQLGQWLDRPWTAAELADQWNAKLQEHLPRRLRGLVGSREWVAARRTLEAYAAAPTRQPFGPTCRQLVDRIHAAEAAGTLEALQGLQSSLKITPGSQPDPATQAAAEAARSFTTKSGALAKAVAEIAGWEPELADGPAALLTTALLAEARVVSQAYDEAKAAARALDFEDLQLRVRDLWRQRPEALAAMRRRIRHLLIDEYQDTSRLQAEVLSPLAGPGRATLFVVGDPKQSIYGWRDADLTVWYETLQNLTQDSGAPGYVPLGKCYRSAPTLLRFFNQLFADESVLGVPPEDPSQRRPYAAYYETDLLPERADERQPAVALYLVSAKPAGHAPAEEGEEETEAAIADLRFAEARLLARRVRELVAGPKPLEVLDRDAGESRPAAYRDFAMLMRSFGDVAIYEWAFRQAGVPTYVYSGGGFYGVQEVRDIISGLRAVENEQDEVALVGVLRSPLFGLSDETLFWVAARGEGEGWWQRLRSAAAAASPARKDLADDEAERLARAVAVLAELRARKNRLRLSELIRELVGRTQFVAVLAGQRGGDQMAANLQKLVDIAAAYETTPSYSLRGFLRWLARLQVREEREGEAAIEDERGNSVKLMTQHSAKGLEWPVVILPDLNRQLPGDRHSYRWHADLGFVAYRKQDERDRWPAIGELIGRQHEAETEAEARRLFYVACTRARDRLLLSSGVLTRTPANGAPRVQLQRGRPLAWLAAAFGWTAEDLAEWVLGDRADLPLEGYARDLIAGYLYRPGDLAALPAPRETPGPPAAAAPAEAQAREALLAARIRPLPRDYRARRRFTATELAVYGFCPRRYELTYLAGWPADSLVLPTLDQREALTGIELGDVVHHLLRLVGTRGLAELDNVLASGLGLPADLEVRAQLQRDELRQHVRWYLDSDLYRQTLREARELRTEMRVIFPVCPDGEDERRAAAVEGVLDAFVVGQDGRAYVLDYKTGDPDHPEDRGMYEFQVGLYCAAVAAWRGEPPAQAWLVYLRPDECRPLPLPVDRIATEAWRGSRRMIADIHAGAFSPGAAPPCHRCPLRRWCPDCSR